MEGLWNSIKGMFVKEDGGIKWASIIGIAAGAAGGYFLAPMIGMEAGILTAAIGGGLGLVGGNLIGGMMGGSEAPEAAAAPAGASRSVSAPQVGQSQQFSPQFPGGKPPASNGRGPG